MAGLSFGVDWYPEQWDRALWESDADRMKAFGIETVRIMEFAWALVEPAARQLRLLALRRSYPRPG